MRRIISLLVFGVITFAMSDTAYGCLCRDPKPEPDQALEEATTVFSGKVIFIETVYINHSDDKGRLSLIAEVQLKFEVDKLWKGLENKTIIVRTNTQGCGYDFTYGQEYLVYAYGEDVLKTSGCTRTALLSKATVDLKALGKPKKYLK